MIAADAGVLVDREGADPVGGLYYIRLQYTILD